VDGAARNAILTPKEMLRGKLASCLNKQNAPTKTESVIVATVGDLSSVTAPRRRRAMSQPATSFLNSGRRRLSSSRVVALLLSLVQLLVMLATIIAMGFMPPGHDNRSAGLIAIDMRGDNQPAARGAERRAKATPLAARAQPAQPLSQPSPPVLPPGFLNLSRQEFAASDISGLPHHTAPGAAPSSDTNGKTYGPVDGPGGVHLFNAEWVREPLHAELAPYLGGENTAGSWATIACRTVEHFHVENCQELDESPPGSGLARALRQAAWQFLVRPPRKDGVMLVGTWVRIRFDVTRTGADEGR